MFRIKTIFALTLMFTLFLSSCAPGAQITLPPDLTLVPGTDIPQQVATYVSNALTQTAAADIQASATPAFGTILPTVGDTSTSTPGGVPPTPIWFPARTLYQSPTLGIQFSYPSAWYRSETNTGLMLTSFDPANPPHKLEWTDQTTSMLFGYKVFITPPAFDAWVESARQTALANGLSIYAEERFQFLFANQPAARLTLVSGSGGIIHQVLTNLNGRYFEINIEGNFDLAKAVLDSMQVSYEGVIKPSDSGTPAAGICADAQGDPVNIVLGTDSSGLPLAGRCIAVNPARRIKLVNQSGNPLKMRLMEYPITLPVGGEILLDRPVGQYLALGVHFLELGPELWVKESAVATAPPPIVEYNNSALGYKLNLPGDWYIDENGMTNSLNKEVIFSPPNAESFIAYLNILLDFRTLDQIIQSYAQNVPDAVREDTMFNGYPGIKYNYFYQGNIVRVEYFIPQANRIFLITTDRPNDSTVQSILMTIRFTDSPSHTTYNVTLADNGKTFIMKIGDELRINLDMNYIWSIASISDSTVIAGAQAGYFAFANGTSTLTMTGNPECLNLTPPCAMPSIMFTITVIVR